MQLSIVLPAFNESERIGVMLDQLVDWLPDAAGTIGACEVIVVDDGSTDDTVAVVEGYRDRITGLRVLTNPVNAGKGAAVATGMLAATGAYRVFLDADGATPVSEIDPLWSAIRDHPRSVVIGSLRVKGAEISRPQTRSRALAGRLGNAVVRLLVLPGVADSQRGCKIFPAELAERVFVEMRTSGWGFDIDVLARCRAIGYDIVEVPVRWAHVPGGAIRPSAYYWTFREVLGIRRALRRSGVRRPVRAQQRTVTGLMPLRREA